MPRSMSTKTWTYKLLKNLNKSLIYLMLIIVDKSPSLKLLIQSKHLVLKVKLRISLELLKLQQQLKNLTLQLSSQFSVNQKINLKQVFNNYMMYLILIILIVSDLKILKKFVKVLEKDLLLNKLIR